MDTKTTTEAVPVSIRFSDNLKALRKLMGLNQKQMADGLGVQPSNYRAYEDLQARPPLEVLHRIQMFTKVGVDVLLGDDLRKHSASSLKQGVSMELLKPRVTV
jgi:transcriptional regulator with XRE-family HTH domain